MTGFNVGEETRGGTEGVFHRRGDDAGGTAFCPTGYVKAWEVSFSRRGGSDAAEMVCYKPAFGIEGG